jgi:hypothetical protein
MGKVIHIDIVQSHLNKEKNNNVTMGEGELLELITPFKEKQDE